MFRLLITFAVSIVAASLAVIGQRSVQVSVRVTDSVGHAIPCRLTITDSNGELADIAVNKAVTIAARKGVIYTATGEAQFSISSGKYMLYASHGPQYSL